MSTITLPKAGTYVVDPVHSSINFVTRHLVAAKVRGQFTEFEGTITVGDTPETSSVRASAQVHSITTANEMRDGHLKSPDFLEQEKYPTIDFVSTSIKPLSDDTFEMVADVTIRGTTKSVPFTLTYLGSGPGLAEGVEIAGFEATAEIDRRDFGVTFDRALDNGSVIVGHKVSIEINVEASLQK